MIQNSKVLLVCDDPINRTAWISCLESQRNLVLRSESIAEALLLWSEEIPDLVLVDLNVTEPDGLNLCAQLRQNTVIPILLLTSRYDEQVVLHGYSVGVDEVLVKPLSPAVFCAKVNAWMRRSRTIPIADLSPVEHAGLCLNPEKREVVLESGQNVHLSNLEFRLLLLLMTNPGVVFERAELVQRVWGYTAEADTVVLKNLVYRLRRKIEPNPNQPVYLCSHGESGYSFQGG